METPPTPNPTKEQVAEWLTEHGDALYRYAIKRLGDRDVAEDLVQDTFLAVLRSASGYQGRSQVLTWLIGILRHKIADHMRKVTRQREREEKHREEQKRVEVFHNGHWRMGLKPWPKKDVSANPAQSMEDREFWQVLNDCREKLPEKLATAFRLRDLEQLQMAEICETLEISTSNLSVRLHRARVLLRECLDQNWFAARRTT